MQLTFKAGRTGQQYEIDGETINGFDLSVVEHGGRFIGNEDTREQGIRKVVRDEHGELWVTLTQQIPDTVKIKGKLYPRGDWRGNGEWIDAADYDPGTLYIKEVTP